MSDRTEIEIERRLRAARPDVRATPPPFAEVLARIERESSGTRARRRARRWRGVPAAIPLLGIVMLLAVGGAAAALLLSRGEPVQPGYVLPATPDTGLGEPVPSSLTLLPIQIPDPGGGPAWGLRAIRTTRGMECLQAGRVMRGELGALGTGYAFGGDQRFHPFLPEDAVATDSCPAVGTGGNAFLPGPPVITPANALPLAGENVAREDQVHCDLPGQQDWGARCPQQELRQVAYGLLGPHARSITVTRADGSSFTFKPYGPLGAYLVVEPAQPNANTSINSGSYQGPFGYVSNAAGGVSLAVTWDDGTTCRLPFSDPAHQCHAHETAPEALPPAAKLATRVEARYVPLDAHPEAPLLMQESSGAVFPAAGGSAATKPGPAVTVRFRAPVAASDASSAYVVELLPRPVPGCATPAVIVSQPSQRSLAAGAPVQITVPLGTACRTRYSGRVFFARSSSVGGESGGEGPLYEAIASHFVPGAPRGRTTLPTVGAFELSVP